MVESEKNKERGGVDESLRVLRDIAGEEVAGALIAAFKLIKISTGGRIFVQHCHDKVGFRLPVNGTGVDIIVKKSSSSPK
ncbi:hypothetical protein KKA69_01820 [Patescibacteria group bacterium]|nr:hypothetical protein [Patescibacteria group bacterium]